MNNFEKNVLEYSRQIYEIAQKVEPVLCYAFEGSELIQAIELLFGKKINPYNPLLVNSGSNALYASLLALELQKGSEILLPINSCQSIVNAIITAGLIPVFIDVDKNLCMDVHDLQRKATPNSKVALAIHPYGYPMDLFSLSEFCKAKNIILIEDCAQAPIAEIHHNRVGFIGEIAIYSFGQNKPISAGGGGMVCCKDQDLAKSIRIIAREGAEVYPNFIKLGFSMSINELHALYMYYWLNNLDLFVSMKRDKNALYQKHFNHIVPFLGEDLKDRSDVYLLMHKFVINVPVHNREELLSFVDDLIERCGSKISRLVQPELLNTPLDMPFVQEYYLDSERGDLLTESNRTFPQFNDTLQKYLYLSINHQLSLDEIDRIARNIVYKLTKDHMLIQSL